MTRELLGIDIGTTTISAAIINIEKSKIIKTFTIENGSSLICKNPVYKEQDPKHILSKVFSLLNFIMQAHPFISSIGLTGQMHGILYIDKQGQSVSPLYTWQDGRGLEIFTNGTTYCDEIKRMTNISVETGYGFVTHFYNIVNGKVPKNAASFCTIMDYVTMHLTGMQKPILHSSNAASIGLFDIATNQFDANALSNLKLESFSYPEITSEAQCLGYYRGIPVAVALGDNQASFLGSVKHEHRGILLNYGTGSQISILSNNPKIINGLDTRPYIDGKYLINGSALCGGKAYELLKRFFSTYLKCCGLFVENEYEILNGLAQEAYTDGRSVMACTAFSGTRENPTKKGGFFNISDSNFTPQQFSLSVLYGMAEELFELYKKIECPDDMILIASGNAVQKNPVFQKILAETFSMPLKISAVKEEAAVGAALFSALATQYSGYTQLKECIGYV